MRYEAIIIWESGEKEIHGADTWTDAKTIEESYKTAFGNQIQWTGTREVKWENIPSRR